MEEEKGKSHPETAREKRKRRDRGREAQGVEGALEVSGGGGGEEGGGAPKIDNPRQSEK